MKKKLRMLGLALCAVLPSSLKRPLLRWWFGYRIGHGVRIGLVYLDCSTLTVGNRARLGHGVLFSRCGNVVIGENALIGSLNLFRGGKNIVLEAYTQVLRLNIINAIPENDCTNNPDSSFYLRYGAVVTAEHRIDFTDRVTIGRCSILGGRNSSIWTHNRRMGKSVEIGDYCYIGSEIRMAPGAKVPNCCIVGLGSVVTEPLQEEFSLIAGVPAQKKRALTPEDYDLIFGKTRSDLPDEEQPFKGNTA